MGLEVPYYEVKRGTFGAPAQTMQLGTIFGKEGTLTGDAGCGCHPLWWLAVALGAGLAVGALAKGDQKKKKGAARR